MKPRVPIEVWTPPPDPLDGLLDDPVPAPSPPPELPRLRTDNPPPAARERIAPSVAPRNQAVPKTREGTPPPKGTEGVATRIRLTVYLGPEDLARLRAEQRRREQSAQRPVRGVTDASSIVRDLIRTRLAQD
jgi:hypothetical protein